jgi:5-methylthioadenosine/S-adenosylhomocysteine deaminase
VKILVKGVLLDGAEKDIFIQDGVIEEISENCCRETDKVIIAKDRAALPSLINGHTHAAMTLMRGYADDMQLQPWLEEKIWPLEARLTEEDVYWGARLACLEMIKNGITVFNDMYWHWEATARAVCDTGMRGFISAVFIDMFDEKTSQAQIARNLELFEISGKYRPHVTFIFGPHAVYTVSKASLEWMKDFSESKGVLIHMHISETENELAFTREKYGLSPIEFLESSGILSERFIGCHGCYLDEQDCKILKRTTSNLVNVPVSNLKLSVGRVFPYSMIEALEIPFCFGTDGCASNNHLDIIETMKFASLLAKFNSHDPTVLPARTTFDHATKAAAQMFGLGNWEIKTGSRTDIILVDLSRPETTPNFDIYSDIVYASNGYIVDTVISMGEVLMENRHVKGEEEILINAKRVARRLVEK